MEVDFIRSLSPGARAGGESSLVPSERPSELAAALYYSADLVPWRSDLYGFGLSSHDQALSMFDA